MSAACRIKRRGPQRFPDPKPSVPAIEFCNDRAEREAFWQERFGERWPNVMEICGEFHRLTGLTLLANSRFEQSG